ncbi:polyketide cyclase [Alteromonas mediterranea]|uniref:SRPBCC family protein n=1 Tax=Alteromonas mediterranea TaxID=314275 RepID=UPI0009033DAD|nr:SRPBCC family protein [Alteromonas mediterranea]APD93828.1 polyketide cyclase [Alteromonas mediterranea]APD97454.1 polyketide cyclase [Alteromonas mediterranea]
MGVLKKLLIVFGAVIAIFVISSFFIPKDYSVERTIIIDAEPSDVYPYVVDLREWKKWGVWFKRDPNMQLTYSGPDRAIGMRSVWESETEGNGEMEITQLEHNKRVLYRLYFPDFDMGSSGIVEIKPTAGGTLVIWRDEGTVDNNPINRYFALLMDGMIGPDFEMGLENLKILVENDV